MFCIGLTYGTMLCFPNQSEGVNEWIKLTETEEKNPKMKYKQKQSNLKSDKKLGKTEKILMDSWTWRRIIKGLTYV